VARNRQKAKQRKARQEANAAKGGGTPPAPAPGEAPPVDEGTVKAAASADAVQEIKRTAKLKPEPAKSSPAKSSPAKSSPKAAAKAPREKGRFRTFLRSSWAELKRVQWPDRKQLTTMTTIVIGFVAIAGAYLGAIDWVAQQIVNFLVF
jgi:preprotein translocase SecE subunit